MGIWPTTLSKIDWRDHVLAFDFMRNHDLKYKFKLNHFAVWKG